MKSNDRDKFESNNLPIVQSDNFFVSEQVGQNLEFFNFVSQPNRRLNNYDTEILQEEAYKDVSDELFKLEYKIAKLEKKLKEIDLQIITAQEINDFDNVEELVVLKANTSNDLENLLLAYKSKSISTKITGSFSKHVNNKMQRRTMVFKDFVSKLLQQIMANLPANLISIIELKKSLEKLESLNKSVDDLVSRKIPYGENNNKYEQLSKYIIKANSIQTEISRQIKK